MKPLIVVCTDFSACSELALQRAADIAGRDETRVFLIHAYDPKKGRGPGPSEPSEGDREGWNEDSMNQLKEARRRLVTLLRTRCDITQRVRRHHGGHDRRLRM